MNRRQIIIWVLLSLIFYLPLALLSKLPLWSVMLLAPAAALLVLRGFLRTTGKAAPPAANSFIQSQNFEVSDIPSCPGCASTDVAKMIYGKPALNRQILAGLESGKIISGGCMIQAGAPEWHCNSCNRDFGHLAFEPPEQPINLTANPQPKGDTDVQSQSASYSCAERS